MKISFYPALKVLAKASAGLAFIEGTALGVGLLLAIAIGRSGGAELLGSFSAAFALISLLALLVDGGFDLEIARSIPAISLEKGQDLVQNTFYSKVWIWLSLLPFVLLFFLIDESTLPLHLCILFGWLLPRSLSASIAALFRSQNRVTEYVRIEVSALVAGHGLAVVLLLLWGSLTYALAALAVVEGIKMYFYRRAVSIYLPDMYCAFTMDRKSFWQALLRVPAMLRQSLSLMGVSLLSGLENRSGVLLLQYGASPLETGLYAAASRFYNVLRVLPGAIFHNALPAFARPGAYQSTFRSSIVLAVIVAVAGGGLLFFGGELLLLFVFGDKFAAAAPLMPLLALRFAGMTFVVILEARCIALHSSTYLAATLFATTLLLIIAGVFFLPSNNQAYFIVQIHIGAMALQLLLLLFPLVRSTR